MTTVLAIDPGTTESAYSLCNERYHPLTFGKVGNDVLLRDFGDLAGRADYAVIEMVASYGMAVGREVFETCVWIGRFTQALRDRHSLIPERVTRKTVSRHHCHSNKATDATVRQALVDRFAHGYGNYGKGTKTAPSPFYGFKADIWAAHAIAVWAIDTYTGQEAPF